MTNPLVRLGALGQSPWYDFITRDLIGSGTLGKLIAGDGLLGMTSNPTIFEKAIASSADYDADIRRATAAGLTAAAIFEQLVSPTSRPRAMPSCRSTGPPAAETGWYPSRCRRPSPMTRPVPPPMPSGFGPRWAGRMR